jgi:hypothetical protein
LYCIIVVLEILSSVVNCLNMMCVLFICLHRYVLSICVFNCFWHVSYLYFLNFPPLLLLES